jgi:hypothetical protein
MTEALGRPNIRKERALPVLPPACNWRRRAQALPARDWRCWPWGSEAALNERARKMKETQHDAIDKLGQIIELGADKTVVAALGETVKSIDDTIKSLGAAATERLGIAAQREMQYDALRKAQTAFAAAAGPAMIDEQTRIRAILGSASLLSQDDAIEAAQAIEQLGNVIAGTNLLASHMMAALSATNSEALEQVEKAFKAAYPNLKSNLDSLTKNNDTAAFEDAALNCWQSATARPASSRPGRKNSTPTIMASSFWTKPGLVRSGRASTRRDVPAPCRRRR